MVSVDDSPRPGAERATDRYGPMFLTLLAILWFAMFIEESRLARVIVGVGVVSVVLQTLSTTGVTRRTMRYALLTALVITGVVVIGGFSDSATVLATVAFTTATALAVSVLALIRRIFEKEQIRVPEIVASLSAYVQLGLAFAFVFAGTARVTNGAFFTNGVAGEGGDFIYFSIVTMTTLGYGDLAPATNLGRSLVIIETLLGQIFLIVLVAYLVGRVGSKRRSIGNNS